MIIFGLGCSTSLTFCGNRYCFIIVLQYNQNMFLRHTSFLGASLHNSSFKIIIIIIFFLLNIHTLVTVETSKYCMNTNTTKFFPQSLHRMILHKMHQSFPQLCDITELLKLDTYVTGQTWSNFGGFNLILAAWPGHLRFLLAIKIVEVIWILC